MKAKQAFFLSSALNKGGGSGTPTSYNSLTNKPQIDGVTLSGNMTPENLNLVSEDKFLETESYIGTEIPFHQDFTDKRIIPSLNELKDEANGASEIIRELQDEVNHIFIDDKEQVSQYFTSSFEQYLFQTNNYFLDGEVSYNVPQPQEVYVKLDFSRVVPLTDTVQSNDHVFGVYKSDYTRVLAIYCTQGGDDEHIKITMLQGGYTIEREIMPSDTVILVSGTGHHSLYVNGELVQAIPNSAKAEKFVVGNALNSDAFQNGSMISYSAYVMDINEQMEKVFIAEPKQIIEDVTFVDKKGNVSKYFLPQAESTEIIQATDEANATTLSTSNPNALVWW